MRTNSSERLVYLCALSALATPAWAETITPNDDSYVDEAAPGAIRDYPPTPATTSTGILIKGQSSNRRFGYAEFTLPDATVTSAVLHMFHTRSFGAGSPTNDWVMQVAGREDSFDETLITWTNTASTLRTGAYTNIGSALTMSGGLSGDGNDVNQPRVLDMTTFFNAHKGTTIVLRFTNTDNNGTKGGTLEDREGSRTGNPANGLYIEYTT